MLPLAGTSEPAPDRMGVVDHNREAGESPNRDLGGHELRVPKWAPIRRKTTEKLTNSGTAFDGIGGYFQWFRRGLENCDLLAASGFELQEIVPTASPMTLLVTKPV